MYSWLPRWFVYRGVIHALLSVRLLVKVASILKMLMRRIVCA